MSYFQTGRSDICTPKFCLDLQGGRTCAARPYGRQERYLYTKISFGVARGTKWHYFSRYDRLHCLVLILIVIMNAGEVKAQWQRISPSSIGENIGSIFAFGSNIFVSTDTDVFRTTDDGLDWSSASLRDSVGVAGSFASVGSDVFYGSGTGVCISTDSGTSWKLSSLNRKGPEAVLGLASIDDARLFAASDWDNLVYSDDFGSTWYLASTNIGTSHFHNVKTVGNLVFAQGEGDVEFNHTGGVVRSSDEGNSWQRVALQNNVVDYGGIGDRFFFSGGDSSFYESDDNGLTWKARPEALPDSVGFACFLSYKSIIFAGSYPGVYLSVDTGITWVSKEDGLPSAAQGIVSLAIHDNYLFAGTVDSGVWRAPLSDFNQSIVGGNGATNSAYILRIFPNPSSSVLQILGGQAGTIHLFDLMGRERMNATIIVGDSKNGTATLDVSSLPPGMYFVSDGHSQTKFVKE
jgi:photosystem II stability/assembly factor-like uncharacterized protein